MKHIAIILGRFGFFGGPERRAYRFALGLRKKGYLVTIVSIMEGNSLSFKEANINGINTIEITKEGGEALKSYRLDVFTKIRKAIKRIKPDTIFTFEFLADYAVKMALLGIKAKIYTFIGATEWKWENKIHRKIIIKKFVRKSIFYVANSFEVKKNIIRVLPEAEKKIKIIRNPIDTNYFRPLDKENRECERNKYGINVSTFVVGSVVRFYNPKGADRLIEAFSKSKIDAKLVLIGDGSMKTKLVEMTEKLGIKDKVLFLGALEATPEIYSMFDVCVIPSQKGGFDNVVIESMSCGIPTIATNATGISEIAKNNKHLLITETKADSISESIKKLFYNYEQIGNQLSVYGRKLIREKLDQNIILKKIEELLFNDYQ